jgi:hypothetical protein
MDEPRLGQAIARWMQLPGASRRAGLCRLVAGLCTLLLLPIVAAAEGDVYMTATFDDKAIDEPIGTGGPAVGEPSLLENLTAVVRDTPFATPCLEISGVTGYGRARFVLPAAVSEGVVAVITDFWSYEESSCENSLVLFNAFGQVAFRLDLGPDRTFRVWDMDGNVVEDIPYAMGRPLPVLAVIDLDARTYSLWVDEVQQVSDRPLHSQITDFQSIELAANFSCPQGNRFSIDQVRILSWAPPVPVEDISWGRLRAMFR